MYKNIDTVWANIITHQNENFFTIKGKSYTYTVKDNYLLVNNDKRRRITKCALAKAILINNPTPSKIEAEGIWGPSYVYGIITDNRIKNTAK